MQQWEGTQMAPPRGFLRMCRRNMRHAKAADSTGAQVNGAGLLMRSLLLRRVLRRDILADDETYVGVLLPPSVGGLVVNVALALDRRIAANLNYTMSSEVINLCIAEAGIRRILTSRRVMERFPLSVDAERIFLDDVREKITAADKLAAAAQTWLWPVSRLEHQLHLASIKPDDVIAVIFTSGSTGDPKGVLLTHHNVATNVEAFSDVLHFDWDDVLLGTLPLFHSFGYTTTLWSAALLDSKVVYHYNPLDYRQVGSLCRDHRATLLVSTATFLRTYLRGCPADDFATLQLIITGAEKLPRDLADAFERKFHVRPYEGYGTTELSPVVSTNVPPNRLAPGEPRADKLGTVGKPIAGVFAKVVDPETGEDLGIDKPGMLLISGDNVMKGYLGQPEETAAVMRDGWYVTGDLAQIDAEGYISITGRQSRFSKIGGEMVPHLRIEEELTRLLAADEGELCLVVTSVPDHRKGERLIVLHTGLSMPPEQVSRELAAAGLPPIWIPSPDSFYQIPSIPVLGTGKPDLRRVRQVAEEKCVVRE